MRQRGLHGSSLTRLPGHLGRVFATAVRTGRRVLAKQHITCPNAPHRLNAVDDLSVLFRLGRLGVALLPGQASLSTMCDICDDVMVDLLKGAEGLQTLPCSWACLKVPECVAMCENLKEFSQNRRAFASDLALIHSPTLILTWNSSRFPCLAAGYCEDETKVDWDEQCHMVYPPAMLAHTHTRARTRTRMLTLARMFARFCFHVSPFALLVLWTPVVLRLSRPC